MRTRTLRATTEFMSSGLSGFMSNARVASGAERGRERWPVVDMIEVMLRVLPGKRAATSCAIMPPIDAPTTCAA